MVRIAGRTIYDGAVGDDRERHTRTSPTVGTLWLAVPGVVGWLLVAASVTFSAHGDLILAVLLIVTLFAAASALLAVIWFWRHRTIPHLCATLFALATNASLVLVVAGALAEIYRLLRAW